MLLLGPFGYERAHDSSLGVFGSGLCRYEDRFPYGIKTLNSKLQYWNLLGLSLSHIPRAMQQLPPHTQPPLLRGTVAAAASLRGGVYGLML